MLLSVSCKAAIKAVIFLGSRVSNEKLPDIQTIAYAINENEHTVAKVLQQLVRAAIIKSSKGPRGGFFILEEQKRIPLIQVIEAVDGKSVFVSCGLGFKECSDIRPCPFHKHYKILRKYFKNISESNSIQSFCDDLANNQAFLSR